MYDQIKECGDELIKTIDIELIKNDNEIEVRDIMGKYSTDVIGTCAFGLKLNSIKDDESPFRKHGKLIFKPSLRVLIRELCVMITPALLKVVRLKKFAESQIVANAFVMFAAGFETVSSTISYCLYELSLNKSIQDRVREEIQLQLSKNDGQINHELLIDLNYLDMVIAGNFFIIILFNNIKLFKNP